MRDIESLRLNQTQKLRFEKALEQLDFLSAAANSNACVAVADTILVDHQDGLLKYTSLSLSLPPLSPPLYPSPSLYVMYTSV